MTELEAHLHKLEEDHRNKQLALALDTRLVTIITRAELTPGLTDAWIQGRDWAVTITKSVLATTKPRN